MNLDRSSIERLKKQLYVRDGQESQPERRRLRELPQDNLPPLWQRDIPPQERSYNGQTVLRYVLIGAVVFFVISLLVSLFLITQSSPISPAKVLIEVQGPAALGGGEELTLQIVVTNKNSADIEDAYLVVEFPEGTRDPEDLEADLPRIRESLGVLGAGKEIQKTAKAVLFGEENTEQTITFYVEYRVGGSNAIFSSNEQAYPVVLTSAPVSVRVEAVKEITSGQILEFKITVASNSEAELKDVLLSAEYPFGFSYTSASPSPAFRNSTWELGDISPEEKKVITVRGNMEGENEQERIFRFNAGARSTRNETELGTIFMTAVEEVAIQKPFIGVDLAVNGGSAASPSVERGSRVRGDVSWYNNLPSRIYDAEITVELSGQGIDRKTITAPNGFYRSADDTIRFTGETERELRELAEGDRGTVSFSFDTLGLAAGMLKESEINVVINIKGNRLTEDSVPEVIESSIARSIRIDSDLSLASRAVYSAGPFKNTGPLPPEASRETTYTILWTVTNSSNRVSDATVTAVIPSYVRFVDAIDPASAALDYNPVGGHIMWDVGDLKAGDRKDVAFQVELEASLGQVGTSPVLLSEQRVGGEDVFTGAPVGGTSGSLTTKLTTDPQFKNGQELVVE